MAATAALSVTSAVDGDRLDAELGEFGDRRDRLGFVASDDGDVGAGLRKSARHAEPMPPLPPVTIATLPRRSNGFAVHVR